MRIWKYSLSKGHNIIQVKNMSLEPLSVMEQNGDLVVYLAVNSTDCQVMSEIEFYVVFTGEEFNLTDYRYLGTVSIEGIIAHVFVSAKHPYIIQA